MSRKHIEEEIARDLFAHLRKQIDLEELDAEIEIAGRGVHWNVQVNRRTHACRIDCFHYGFSGDEMILVMGNQHLRDVSATPPNPPRRGVEYAIDFYEEGANIASGRTQDRCEATEAIRDWLIEKDLAALHTRHAFVDRKLRALRELASVIEPTLEGKAQVVIEDELGYELWIYASQRSCQVEAAADGTIGCAFLHLGTQLARASASNIDQALLWIDAWESDQVDLAEFRRRCPQVEIKRHAELFEKGDVSAWLWTHLAESAKTDGVLSDYRPLIERIRESPSLSSFYAFTSLDRLCFSLCSHYPFATQGMPILRPISSEDPAQYAMRTDETQQTGNTDQIIEALEEVLSKIKIEPWHGIEDDIWREPINRELEKMGSSLRVGHVYQTQWRYPGVASASLEVHIENAGKDLCTSCDLTLFENREEIECKTAEGAQAAAEIIVDWLG